MKAEIGLRHSFFCDGVSFKQFSPGYKNALPPPPMFAFNSSAPYIPLSSIFLMFPLDPSISKFRLSSFNLFFRLMSVNFMQNIMTYLIHPINLPLLSGPNYNCEIFSSLYFAFSLSHHFFQEI